MTVTITGMAVIIMNKTVVIMSRAAIMSTMIAIITTMETIGRRGLTPCTGGAILVSADRAGAMENPYFIVVSYMRS